MRLITIFFLFCLLIRCGGTKDTTATTTTNLNGTWIPIRQEMAGVTLPQIVFEFQKLSILDTTYTFIAESVDKGIIKYTSDKMDIYGKEGVNAGKHFTAIYKFLPNIRNEKDQQLTICYNLSGDKYPESYETKGKTSYFMSVFKRN